MNAPLHFSAVSAEHPFPGLRPFREDEEHLLAHPDEVHGAQLGGDSIPPRMSVESCHVEIPVHTATGE